MYSNSKRISIIIPVYGVEKFIRRCLMSVIKQTYRNLEVICVNDATKDRSIQIAKEIVRSANIEEMSFSFIEHQKNRGLSAARNSGVRAATGEYIYFLDSDDEILPQCIENLFALAEKYKGVDVVQGNLHIVDSCYNWLVFKANDVPEYTNDKQWIEKNFLAKGMFAAGKVPVTAWNKLFNRQFFVDNELWYKEGIVFEDDYWRLMNYDKINSMAFCYEETYIYHQNSDSIMRNSQKNFKKWNSYLTIEHDNLMRLNKSDIQQIKYAIYSFRYRFNSLQPTVPNSKKQKALLNKCIIDILNKSHIQLRYKLILSYLLLPIRFVSLNILGRILQL